MKPSDSTLDTAVMRIFRDNLVLREGQRLSFQTLIEDWGKNKFRQTDLFESLDRLERNGELTTEASPDTVYFALTHLGVQLITGVPREPKTLLRVLASAVQLSARNGRGESSSANVPHTRRATDRPQVEAQSWAAAA